MSKKYFISYIVVLFIFIIITTLFYPITTNTSIASNVVFSSKEFIWPVPGYTTITSNFGYRNAPASGASTFHGAIDIAAPQGSNIVSSTPGKVVYTGFYGASGFTVLIETNNLILGYSHVGFPFLVESGENVEKGQIIAKVGPKNVYNVPNNPYKDKNGNPTNGATTGPHLHFSIKKDGQAVNPLYYISSSSS